MGDPAVCVAAALALGRVMGTSNADASVVQDLVSSLDSEEPSVNLAATEALGQLSKKGNMSAVSLLTGVLKSSSPSSNRSAKHALQRLPANLRWLAPYDWQRNPNRGALR